MAYTDGSYATRYSLAAKGKSVLTMTGSLVWGSILPMAARLWKEGERQRFESLAAKALVAVCGVQLILTMGCMAFAREIILLVGGEAYLESVDAFRILLLSLVPIGASNILGGMVLIPAGKESRLLRAQILGAVFNFLANLVLIPVMSIEGAALTTVVSEVIVWIVCLHYVKKDLEMSLGAAPFGKAAKKIARPLYVLGIRALSKAVGDRLPLYCPCCDTYLKAFIEGGFARRPDLYNAARYEGIDQKVICPVCGSMPRHRILVSWMDRNREQLEGKKILHFAQEKSVRMWLDRNGIEYTTADLFHPADLKIDLCDIMLPDASVDVVICNHVLEHVPDYRKALEQIRRIIRQDGFVLLSFPVDPKLETVYEDSRITSEKERVEHFGQYDHLRVFGMDSARILADAGFEVEEIRGADCDHRIKAVVGPADYDWNVLWCLRKRK